MCYIVSAHTYERNNTIMEYNKENILTNFILKVNLLKQEEAMQMIKRVLTMNEKDLLFLHLYSCLIHQDYVAARELSILALKDKEEIEAALLQDNQYCTEEMWKLDGIERYR